VCRKRALDTEERAMLTGSAESSTRAAIVTGGSRGIRPLQTDTRVARATRGAAAALMFGNFVTGVAVLAPAGMLNVLAAGLGVSIQQAGWLVTFGAVVLCIGSPLVAWATSTVDRRILLTATLALLAAGNRSRSDLHAASGEHGIAHGA